MADILGGIAHTAEDVIHPAKRAVLNVLTGGEYQHPGSLAQYGKSVAGSFDPRTRAGLTNWAGILVPGGRGKLGEGVPTAAQQALLDAIQGSSYRPRNYIPPIGTVNKFKANDPGVQALAQHLGMPRATAAAGGHQQAAISPLSSLLSRQGEDRLGLHPDTNRLSWSRTNTNKPWLNEILGAARAEGPPASVVDWLRGLIETINKSR